MRESNEKMDGATKIARYSIGKRNACLLKALSPEQKSRNKSFPIRVLEKRGASTGIPADGQRLRIYRAVNAEISERKQHSFSSDSHSDIKTAVVECYYRMLKERMWRYFIHKNTRRYIAG